MFAASKDKYRAIVSLTETDNIRLRRTKIETKLKFEKPTKGKGCADVGKVNEIT